MFSLFPDEQIITQSDGAALTLTTHRICYEYKEWGRAYHQNIMLEHITSSENYHSSHIWLLLAAGLCGIWSFMAGAENSSRDGAPSFLLGLALTVIYLGTRRNYIVIASPSSRMKVELIGMKREEVLDFIDKIEQAKNERLNALNGRMEYGIA